ncbi:unnamed protein product [Prorocentrum cordatum]|uniref:Protein kinase domain-containing protein n=1 Tax=Prorocentrum cordatum TaxID=2364126 RepID=A0ABN9VVN6_9DINO|nr:unnamed protein product [Polarella glacialis]
MATSAVLPLVAHTFALPWYAARVLGVEPAALGESFGSLTDTRHVLAIDLLVTGTHLALPVRPYALAIVEVASFLGYVVPAWALGGPEMEDAPFTTMFLACLIGAAAWGKRSMEFQERVQFLTLIRERSLRFQSEFALSQHQLGKFKQQGVSAPSEPSEAGKESLPSTTESGRVFSGSRSGISKDLIDELAAVGAREQWLIRQEEITVIQGRQLGEGAFGRVVRARYQGIHVAVKVPKVRTKRITDNSHLVEVCDELRVLRRIRHPNIVLFYGAALDQKNHDLALVLELVDGVSVRSLVRGGRRDEGDGVGPARPSAMERSQVLVDVACALQYLHSRTPAIAHAPGLRAVARADAACQADGWHPVLGRARALADHGHGHRHSPRRLLLRPPRLLCRHRAAALPEHDGREHRGGGCAARRSPRVVARQLAERQMAAPRGAVRSRGGIGEASDAAGLQAGRGLSRRDAGVGGVGAPAGHPPADRGEPGER